MSSPRSARTAGARTSGHSRMTAQARAGTVKGHDMPRRNRAPERTGPKYPGSCDFTSEPDENGKRWWEYRAAEPDPGDDPDYDEDCGDC